MAGIGTLIRASEYNSIQAKVSMNLGSGSGDQGYGQSLASSQVAVGDKIFVSQWSNLRTDMLKARQHQTGVDESGNLTLPLNTMVVTEAMRSQYDSYATTINSNRFTVAGNQSSLETLKQDTRTAAWNGTLTNTITVTFANADQARYFFNGGGNFQLSAALSGGSGGSKYNTWTTMFSQSGVITLNYNSTTSNGASPGTVYSYGYYNLTTTDQTIYYKPAPSGVYAENDWYITARIAGGGSQVIFTLRFEDNDAGDQQGGFLPGPAQDENVDGTFTNTLQALRPSGSNVSVSAPSVSSTGI
jgi:hypothetical protein